MAEVEQAKDGQLDRATDPEYAAISTLAVVGLVLGILGLTAFLALPLAAVPAIGCGVSLLARRKIGQSRGVLAGGRLAAAGILIGASLAVLGAGYHAKVWWNERQILNELQGRAMETVDDLLAGRFDQAFERIAPDSPQRKAGAEMFRKGMTLLLGDAGKVIRRDLIALPMLPTESGALVAPADVRVDLERRIVEITVWFRPTERGTWEVAGIGGQETFESAVKYGIERPPPAVLAPYERVHTHDH